MDSKRKIIESYHQAVIDRDLGAALSLLATDFYLKSPIDDFSGLNLFEERCWPFGQGVQKFMIKDFTESGDLAFFTYHVVSQWGTMRCAEVFRFANEKIAAMDIYWGMIPDKIPGRD